MIRIILHNTDSPTVTVDVDPNSAIQVLGKHIPGKSAKFLLYKNTLISDIFTFGFYGIKDGDNIYVVREMEEPPPKLKPHYFSDYNKLSPKSEITTDLSREGMRLLDLAKMRCEISPKHLFSPQDQLYLSLSSQAVPQTNTCYSATEPSTSSLPPPW